MFAIKDAAKCHVTVEFLRNGLGTFYSNALPLDWQVAPHPEQQVYESANTLCTHAEGDAVPGKRTQRCCWHRSQLSHLVRS